MPGLRPDETPEVGARLLRTLYELSYSAGRTLDPGELVKLVAEHACELLHGDAVALYLWDDEASLLMPVFTNDPRQPTEDQPLKLGQGAAGQAVQSRQPVVVEDYDNYAHAVAWGLARQLKSVEAVPLMVDSRAPALVHAAVKAQTPIGTRNCTYVRMVMQVSLASRIRRIAKRTSFVCRPRV